MKRMPIFVAALAASALAGCMWVPVPVNTHAGPGRGLIVGDGDTRRPMPTATVLVEHYRIEGAMHTAPVIRLMDVQRVPLNANGSYRLPSRWRLRRAWVVWMPETGAAAQTRYNTTRDVVSLKIFARGHESIWLPVEGPLTGLDMMETPDGPMLLLRALPKPEQREAAIDLVARHGWPPGPKQTTGDVCVEAPACRAVAEVMTEAYEQLLADCPQYQETARVRTKIDRWKRDLK